MTLHSGCACPHSDGNMCCCASAVLDETEESGWKNIHGEVFRFPPNKNLFCAFVGSGFQVSLRSQPCLLHFL